MNSNGCKFIAQFDIVVAEKNIAKKSYPDGCIIVMVTNFEGENKITRIEIEMRC